MGPSRATSGGMGLPPVDTGVMFRGAAAAADGLGRSAKRSSRDNSNLVDHVDGPGRDLVGLLSVDGARSAASRAAGRHVMGLFFVGGRSALAGLF